MNDERFTDAAVTQGETELAFCLTWLSEEGILPDPLPAAGLCVPDFGTLRALIIHQRANGWVADILFADVAPGAPEIIGTPDNMPAFTLDNARMQGWQMVARLFLENLSHHHANSRVPHVRYQ